MKNTNKSTNGFKNLYHNLASLISKIVLFKGAWYNLKVLPLIEAQAVPLWKAVIFAVLAQMVKGMAELLGSATPI